MLSEEKYDQSKLLKYLEPDTCGRPGGVAPDFELNSVGIVRMNSEKEFSRLLDQDSTYSMKNLKGKVVLLNFWATWCGPCIMEIPDFNELYQTYQPSGFELLGVSIQDTKKQLANFVKSNVVNYPVLYGVPKEINQMLLDYELSNPFYGISIPQSLLINRQGKIVWYYPGALLKSYSPEEYAKFLFILEQTLKNS